MTRPLLRCLGGIFLVFACALVAAGGWLSSPYGARAVSRWATSRIEKQAPGTRVTLERLRFRKPWRVEAAAASWGRPGEPPAVRLERVTFRLAADLAWSCEAPVARVELAALDRILWEGKWQAEGTLTGRAAVSVRGAELRSVELLLEAQPPGGSLGREVLERLLRMIPEQDSRGQLIRAVEARPSFHFDIGKIVVATEAQGYRVAFLLDGDHLLDITVRLPKESLKLLTTLL